MPLGQSIAKFFKAAQGAAAVAQKPKMSALDRIVSKMPNMADPKHFPGSPPGSKLFPPFNR